MLEQLFSPLKIGKLELKNRLVVPAMSCSFCEPMNGQVTDRFINYYAARAKGGWGLLITEYTTVDKSGKAVLGQPALWDDSLIVGHKKLTDAVHKYDGKIFVQLHHAGRETVPDLIGGEQTVTSSAMLSPMMPTVPRELSTDEVKALVVKFIDAAERAKKAGYDGVEVHGAHGYFIAQFLSLYVNKRTDEYGGSLLNRARIVMEIISGIKERCGRDFPVIFRISVDEFSPGGNTIEDVKTIAVLAEQSGADAIHGSCGTYYSMDTIIAASSARHGVLTDYSAELKNTVSIPVIAVNRINDPILADTILKSGKADAIAMGRGSLADPELPDKAKEGKFEEIRNCISCLQGCIGHYYKGIPTGCMINPATGREAELAIKPAGAKKKVFIAGGGPGGMEAAIVAAQRGHEVELFEKGEKLGGQFLLASVPPYKGEVNTFTIWQKNQLKKYNVKVHLNTALTPELVANGKADAVIVATGAEASMPKIKGVENPKVVQAADVLAGKVVVGLNAVVIGGGQVGAETANHLAQHNRKVTIVEILPEIAVQEVGPVLRVLLRDLASKNVQIYVNTKVLEITEEGLKVCGNGKEEISLAADTIVIATGSKSVNDLAEKLQGKVKNLVMIGDAAKVGTAEEAILEGYQAGLEV